MASKFIRGIFKMVTGGKTSPTIKSVTPNVGNLKKNKETIKKLTDTTDKYVKTANEKGFKDLAKDLRKSGSKSLQKTDKILRKNKKDGGRMGLKGGGSDMGSTTNKSINSLKNALANRKNRKKSKISKNNFKRERSPMEVNRVMSKMKSDAQAMGGDVRTAGEMKPLKGESQKSFDSRYKPMKTGGRMGLKSGSKFPDHSGDGKITKKDILMAKGVIPKTKNKKSKKKFI